MDRKLIVVAGVSSSGKSTFIDTVLIPNLVRSTSGLDASKEIDVKFAGRLRDNFYLGDKNICIVHYNSLLQLDTHPHLENIDLSDEPVFNNLLNSAYESAIYLCYTPDNILLERMMSRTQVEPLLREGEQSKYPTDHVLNGFKKVNQRSLLLDFAEKFQHVTNDIQVVFSDETKCSTLALDDFKYGIPNTRIEEIIS